VFVEESFAVRPNRKIFTFLRKKLLRLIDYGLYFCGFGQKTQKPQNFRKHFLPLK